MCDPTRLTQVLINLCSNAFQVIFKKLKNSILFANTRKHTHTHAHIYTHAHAHACSIPLREVRWSYDWRPSMWPLSPRRSTVSVRFSVIDTGSGMSPTEVLYYSLWRLPRAFAPHALGKSRIFVPLLSHCCHSAITLLSHCPCRSSKSFCLSAGAPIHVQIRRGSASASPYPNPLWRRWGAPYPSPARWALYVALFHVCL
jgi:hypothetical protein